MPISVVNAASGGLESAVKNGEFLIFYSSHDENGKLWCPDCVAVEELVQATFAPEDAPTASIVYVGQRHEWKSPSNVFRGEPWRIQSIPTIIRVRNSKEDARLVDTEIKDQLTLFIQG